MTWYALNDTVFWIASNSALNAFQTQNAVLLLVTIGRAQRLMTQNALDRENTSVRQSSTVTDLASKSLSTARNVGKGT